MLKKNFFQTPKSVRKDIHPFLARLGAQKADPSMVDMDVLVTASQAMNWVNTHLWDAVDDWLSIHDPDLEIEAIEEVGVHEGDSDSIRVGIASEEYSEVQYRTIPLQWISKTSAERKDAVRAHEEAVAQKEFEQSRETEQQRRARRIAELQAELDQLQTQVRAMA